MLCTAITNFEEVLVSGQLQECLGVEDPCEHGTPGNQSGPQSDLVVHQFVFGSI